MVVSQFLLLLNGVFFWCGMINVKEGIFVSVVENCVYGLAFGDAWGNKLEFLPHDRIMLKERLFPSRGFVTDDTQMSLYALTTLLDDRRWLFSRFMKNDSQVNADKVRVAFLKSFVVFGADPNNDRAPGRACMKAIHAATRSDNNLGDGQGFTNWDSKGCGANMRNPWFGLLPVSRERIALLSVLQCETTHSHPLALSSAIITALCVRDVVDGRGVFGSGDGVAWIKRLCDEALTYDYGKSSERVFDGLRELTAFVEDKQVLYDQFLVSDHNSDISLFLGEGWVAEEALLNAVGALERYGVLRNVDGFLAGVNRLVCSSGDSDSIGAIGGALLGANLIEGEKLPAYENHLEVRYQGELSSVITRVIRLRKQKNFSA